MLRLYTSSHDLKRVESCLKPYSNWCDRKSTFAMPSLNAAYGFRVIICTLTTSSHFSRANGDPSHKPEHFTHIFIDESANTHETMTMVAIAGE